MKLDDILTTEIDAERQYIRRIMDLKEMDDLSREMIRLRVYETYKQLIYLNELEQA